MLVRTRSPTSQKGFVDDMAIEFEFSFFKEASFSLPEDQTHVLLFLLQLEQLTLDDAKIHSLFCFVNKLSLFQIGITCLSHVGR